MNDTIDGRYAGRREALPRVRGRHGRAAFALRPRLPAVENFYS